MKPALRKATVAGVAAVTAAAALLAGGGPSTARAGTADGGDAVASAGGHGAPRGKDRVFRGRFAPIGTPGGARTITYDQKLVPEGARIEVRQHTGRDGMAVRVAVRGVARNHTFGVHVHTRPCGARPDDSGPHYQHRKDPRQPSTDPRYANPYNEVWLDFTSDEEGRGHAGSVHPWTFRKGEARSVVLHESATHTEPGRAGQAGARAACFTVPFSGRG
ncbi:superoxide dismutase family protein [Streptomyces cacaoi]|uniref:superoxide dismutase family protein n=1 Tax=Streptomyces cacaoi TaxID=1898 RepID=UPI00332EF037